MEDGVLTVGDGYRAKNDELGPAGLPFARAGNIDAGFNFVGADCLRTERIELAGEKVSRVGDVVFTSKGTVGRFAFVAPATPKFVYSPQLCFWRSLRPSELDPAYLFVWMRGGGFGRQVDAVKGQTDMADYVSLRDQRAMVVDLPPIGEQRRIARIIGALDDKIELNRRMNETLEAMARALFKSWFVDFDPVRAKAEGRAPAGMDAATAALFPSRLVQTAEGEVPEGWDWTTLRDLTVKIGSGATPRGGEAGYVQEGIALVRSQNVYDMNFAWDGLARITDQAAHDLSSVSLCEGDVLINITGASFLRTCIVDPGVLPARVNQHVAIVRAGPGVSPRFIHLQLLSERVRGYLAGLDAGASRQAITKGHLESVLLPKPSPGVIAAFDQVVCPLYARRDRNGAEARTLSKVRDALLPRLLSGELRLGDTLAREDAA
ncbi:MAG: restriction endonuclease subunit S [Deltaproteobacteria bacterium]|nr:restriction endonuclease subunit S [Deltaproteobacteria bacterium]